MASPAKDLHFILVPLMAQGHMIPMVDIARILALCGARITIVTTPVNANRFRPVIARAAEENLGIQLLEFQLPSVEGLPEGCENFDMLPTAEDGKSLFVAIGMLHEPVEKALHELKPKPSCIISDMFLHWTTDIAQKLHIPRLVFHGPGCFPLLSMHNLVSSGIMEGLTSDSQRFLIPGLPDQIEVTKAQVFGAISISESGTEFFNKLVEAERAAYGIVVNSFQELEPEYAREYTKVKDKRVWCIGPVSLSNENLADKAERGNKAAIDKHYCIKWLDLQEPKSVLYICLGSLSRTSVAQMIELGLALELANRPFIWCVRNKSEDLEKWFSEGFEERVRDRGLVIHGWAPQVLILSHEAIGGFVTHCGWNSTLEGVCAGLPMITWPHFAEQFINEKFIVEVLKIGVRIGVEVPVMFGEEEKIGLLLKKEEIKSAVDSLMTDKGREADDRRKRARELAELAKRATEEGGSSNVSITLLIRDVIQEVSNKEDCRC